MLVDRPTVVVLVECVKWNILVLNSNQSVKFEFFFSLRDDERGNI
jgi:hypothetical protein